MGVKFTLAGQDITYWTDELSLDIESNLGQGPGVPQGGSGRATTCAFTSLLGPQGAAIGAGQSSLLPMNAYRTAVLADSPVAYYRLNEPAGSLTVADTMGLNGSAGWSGAQPLLGVMPGPVGGVNCSAMNGGYWSVPYSSLPTGNSSCILECWISWIPNGATQTAMSLGTDSSNEEMWIGVNASGQPMLKVVNGPSLSGSTAILPNTWHQLVGVYNGAALTLWLDGVSLATTSYSSLNLVAGSAGIGTARNIGNNWAGSLGECAFYNTAIGGARIQAHYNARAALPVLVRQGEVIVYDSNNLRIFGGYATDFQDKTEYTKVKTEVTCSDYWQDLARRVVNQIYTSEYDNQILANLFATYSPDIDLSQWAQVQTYLFTKIYLRSKTMQESVQKIADTVGFDVWIDPYKRFQYKSPSSSGTAPFALSDSPDLVTSFPLQVTKYEKDDTAIINRVYFYGGKTPSLDFTQDLSPQANGTNNTFVLAYYPQPSSDGNVDFYIGGVLKAMGQAFGTGPANTLKQNGGTADALLNSSAQAITVDSSEIPSAGTSVSCKYRYEIPLTIQTTNQASYAFFGRWYDGTISDTTVQDKTTAIQRARILLQEQAYGFEHITLNCWRPGLQAGMLLRIDHNVRDIHNVYIVQTVKIIPLGAGNFQYEVDLGAWNWNLVDVMVQAGRLANLIDQLDDESQDVVNAEQALQNLGVHIIWKTPVTRTSGGYYARATAVGDGHDAYPGLFTITS